MPQALKAYKNGNKDFYAADVEKRDILELYRDDIKKAADYVTENDNNHDAIAEVIEKFIL